MKSLFLIITIIFKFLIRKNYKIDFFLLIHYIFATQKYNHIFNQKIILK